LAMEYRLLLVDVYWLTESGEALGPGYVLVDRGRLASIEPGEPGEEEQYAEMVAGGLGRLVLPGMAGVAVPELYVARGALGPGEAPRALLGSSSAGSLLEEVGVAESYYATLVAAWDAMLNGITRLIVVSRSPAAAAQALSDAGLTGLVLVPDDTCRGTPLRGHALDEAMEEARKKGADMARVHMAPLSCGGCGDGWCLDENGLHHPALRPHGEAPIEWLLPTTAPWSLLYATHGAAWRLLVEALHRAAEPGYQPYRGAAHLAVLDLTQPPAWVPPVAACPACLGPTAPRVETLISGGRVVVDGGEPLQVGATAAAEAAARLEKLALAARTRS